MTTQSKCMNCKGKENKENEAIVANNTCASYESVSKKEIMRYADGECEKSWANPHHLLSHTVFRVVGMLKSQDT